jgi:hypothetical protein
MIREKRALKKNCHGTSQGRVIVHLSNRRSRFEVPKLIEEGVVVYSLINNLERRVGRMLSFLCNAREKPQLHIIKLLYMRIFFFVHMTKNINYTMKCN